MSNNLTRAEIIVKGKVQRVAYRDAVDDIAAEIDITGFVENLKPRDARIIAEGEEDDINKFIESIRIKKFPINVKEVIVEFKPPTGEFEYFEIKRGDPDEEMGERLDIAGTLLYKSLEKHDETVAILKDMKGTQEDMKGTQEEIKGTLGDIKNTQEDMKKTIGDIKDTQDHTNTKISIIAENTEVIKYNTSRLHVMEKEITILKEDMAQVKKVLALA